MDIDLENPSEGEGQIAPSLPDRGYLTEESPAAWEPPSFKSASELQGDFNKNISESKESFAGFVAKENMLTNNVWKVSDSLLSIYEDLTGDFEGYDSLSEEERGKYEPKYWPVISTAKNPYQAGRMVLRAQEIEHYDKLMENGSILGVIAGSIYTGVINPTSWIPILRGIDSPKFLTNVTQGVAGALPSIAIGGAIEEANLMWAQPGRTTKEAATNFAGGLIFGSAATGLGGGLRYLGQKNYQKSVTETVAGAEVKTMINDKGEVTGLSIQDGGSVGAGKAEDVPFEGPVGVKLEGTDKAYHPANLAFLLADKVTRNPIAQGLRSKSATTSTAIHELLEHNYDVRGVKGELARESSIQSKIKDYQAQGIKFQSELIKAYHKQLGLDETGNIVGNAVKAKFAKDQDGYMKFDKFMNKVSIAITEGGIDSEYPIVAQFAKKTIKDILEPNAKVLEEMKILPPGFAPYGAAQHLKRNYDIRGIIAKRPDKIDDLAGYYGEVNEKVISAKSQLDTLQQQLGRAEFNKALAKSDVFDKEIKQLQNQVKREEKNLNKGMLQGKYPVELLTGERGMNWDQLEELKRLRKPIKKAKLDLKQAEQEFEVYKREGKPVEQIQSKIKESSESLKKLREDMSAGVEAGEIDSELFYKTKQGNYRLKKANKGTLKFRDILDDAQLKIAAENTISNITKSSPDQITTDIMGMFKSGGIENIMNPRVLLAPDKWLYDKGFLVTDLRKTVPNFMLNMGRTIETEKYFRSKGYKPGVNSKLDFLGEGISKDYADMREVLEATVKRKVDKAKTPEKAAKIEAKAEKQRLRLDADMKRDALLMERVLSRISGEVPKKMGNTIRAFRALNNYAYTSQLGLMLCTMLADSVAPLFVMGSKYISHSVVPFIKNTIIPGRSNKKFVNALKDWNIGIDTQKALLNQMQDVGLENELPMAGAERLLQRLTDISGLTNLSSPWTDMWSRIAASGMMSNNYRMYKEFLDGTIDSADLKQLKRLRMDDKKLCERIVKSYTEDGGEELDGAFLMNEHLWKDADAAARVRMAVRQTLDSVIFSGKDISSYPINLEYHGLSNSMLMYFGWLFKASANFTLPTIQGMDKRKVAGLMAMAGAAMFQDPMRKIFSGREIEEEDLDPQYLITKGVLNSGILGVYGELFNRSNAAFNIFPELQVDRFKNKSSLELVSGAPYSVINLIGLLSGQGFNNEWNKKELKDAKRNAPLVDNIFTRKFTNDYIDSLEIPETREAARKQNMLDKGILPEKKPKKKKIK